jgi:hypothetical protein
MSCGGNTVKRPSDLPQATLVHLVEQIQYLLYREVSLQGVEVWNSEKEWDSETLDYLAEVLREAELTSQNHDA